MRKPSNLDWQVGEEAWMRPDNDEPHRRGPSLHPWLLPLLIVLVVWGWWSIVRPANEVAPATPTSAPTLLATTPAPSASPTASPTPLLPNSSRLYHVLQTEKGTRSLLVFNPVSGRIIRRLPVGEAPQYALAPDGATLYVADFVTISGGGESSRLRIFNTRSWMMTRQTELPHRVRWPRNAGPPALIMAPDSAALYAQRFISQTYVIDRLDPITGEIAAPGTFEALTAAACDQRRFVFASADGRFLYDLCPNGRLHVNDLLTRRLGYSLTLPSLVSPAAPADSAEIAGAALSPDGHALYAVSAAGLVSQVDLRAGQIVTQVQLPLLPGQRVMPYRVARIERPVSLALGLSRGSEGTAGLASEIWFYDLERQAITAQWVVDPPFASMAVSPDIWRTAPEPTEENIDSDQSDSSFRIRIAMHYNDEVLVTSDPLGQQLHVYDLATGVKKRTISDVGGAWSQITLAPAPVERAVTQTAANDRLLLLDAGGADVAAGVQIIEALSGETVQTITLTRAALDTPPDMAMSPDGSRVWLLDSAAPGRLDRLRATALDAGQPPAAHDLPNPAAAASDAGRPPLLLGLPDNQVIVQQIASPGQAAWLGRFALTAEGIRPHKLSPSWQQTPPCGPAHLLWRKKTQELLALCQPTDGPAQLTILSWDDQRPPRTLTLPAALRLRSAVLTPDQSRLYALADGPTVLPIHLDDLQAEAPIYLSVFEIIGRPLGQPVISADGRTLYLALTFPADPLAYNTLLGTAWALDTQSWRISTRLGMERTFVDLTLSPDGQRLYALDATIGLNAYTHNIFVFDTARNVLIRKIPFEAVNPVRLIVAPAPP